LRFIISYFKILYYRINCYILWYIQKAQYFILRYLAKRFTVISACKRTIMHKNCLPEDEPTKFETCRRHQKLNIVLENCTFCWFDLYNSCSDKGFKCFPQSLRGEYKFRNFVVCYNLLFSSPFRASLHHLLYLEPHTRRLLILS
jgi:hypothetical protein